MKKITCNYFFLLFIFLQTPFFSYPLSSYDELSSKLTKVDSDLKTIMNLAKGLGSFYMKRPEISANQFLFLTKKIKPVLIELREEIRKFSVYEENENYGKEAVNRIIFTGLKFLELRARYLDLRLKFYYSPLRYSTNFTPNSLISNDEQWESIQKDIESLSLELAPISAYFLRNALVGGQKLLVYGALQTIKPRHIESPEGDPVVQFVFSEMEKFELELNALSSPESRKEYALLIQYLSVSQGLLNRETINSLFTEGTKIKEQEVKSCVPQSLFFSDQLRRSSKKTLSSLPLATEGREYSRYRNEVVPVLVKIIEKLSTKGFDLRKNEISNLVDRLVGKKSSLSKKIERILRNGNPYDDETYPFWVEKLKDDLREIINIKRLDYNFFIGSSVYTGDEIDIEKISSRIAGDYSKRVFNDIFTLLNIELSSPKFRRKLKALNDGMFLELTDFSEKYRKKIAIAVTSSFGENVVSEEKKVAFNRKVFTEKIYSILSSNTRPLQVWANSKDHKVNLQPKSPKELREYFEDLRKNHLSTQNYKFLYALDYHGPLRAVVDQFFIDLNNKYKIFSDKLGRDLNVNLSGEEARIKFENAEKEAQQFLWGAALNLAAEYTEKYTGMNDLDNEDFINWSKESAIEHTCDVKSAGCGKLFREYKPGEADYSSYDYYGKYRERIQKVCSVELDLTSIPHRGYDDKRRYGPYAYYKKFEVMLYDFFKSLNLVPQPGMVILPTEASFLDNPDFLVKKRVSQALAQSPLLQMKIPYKESRSQTYFKVPPTTYGPYSSETKNYDITQEENALKYIFLNSFSTLKNELSFDKVKNIVKDIFEFAKNRSEGLVESWCLGDSYEFKNDKNFQSMFRNVSNVRSVLTTKTLENSALPGSDGVKQIEDFSQMIERMEKYDVSIAKISRTKTQKLLDDIVSPSLMIVSAVLIIVSLGSFFLFASGIIATTSFLATVSFFGHNAFLVFFLTSFSVRMTSLFYDTPEQLKIQKHIGQSYISSENPVDWDNLDTLKKQNLKAKTSPWLLAEATLELWFGGQIVKSVKRFSGSQIRSILKKWKVPVQTNLKPKPINIKDLFSKTDKSYSQKIKNMGKNISVNLMKNRYHPYNDFQLFVIFRNRLFELSDKYLNSSHVILLKRRIISEMEKLKARVIPYKKVDSATGQVVELYRLKGDLTVKEWFVNPHLQKTVFLSRTFLKALFSGKLPQYLKMRMSPGAKLARDDFFRSMEALRGEQIRLRVKTMENMLEKIKRAEELYQQNLNSDEAINVFKQFFDINGELALASDEIFLMKDMLAPGIFPRYKKSLFKEFPGKTSESYEAFNQFKNAYSDYLELLSVKFVAINQVNGGVYTNEYLDAGMFFSRKNREGRNFFLDGPSSANIYDEILRRHRGKIKDLGFLAGQLATPAMGAAMIAYKYWEEFKIHQDERKLEKQLSQLVTDLKLETGEEFFEMVLEDDTLKDHDDFKAFYKMIKHELDVTRGRRVKTHGQKYLEEQLDSLF